MGVPTSQEDLGLSLRRGPSLRSRPVTWRGDGKQISVKNKTEEWVST